MEVTLKQTAFGSDSSLLEMLKAAAQRDTAA